MTIYNMKYPEWHPVDCGASLQVDILCSSVIGVSAFTQEIFKRLSNCKRKYILYKGNCYLIDKKLIITDTTRKIHQSAVSEIHQQSK